MRVLQNNEDPTKQFQPSPGNEVYFRLIFDGQRNNLPWKLETENNRGWTMVSHLIGSTPTKVFLSRGEWTEIEKEDS